jgi:hypothetical protein
MARLFFHFGSLLQVSPSILPQIAIYYLDSQGCEIMSKTPLAVEEIE